MHLKSHPKLMRSDLRLDVAGVQTSSQRNSLFVGQQGELLKTCSSNHGNINSSRLPFSVISTNTLCCINATNANVSSSVASLRLKPSCSAALQLLSPPPLGCENDTLRLYQTATEDTDAPLDIWTVIKPGHVREKIAMFASEGGGTEAGGSESTSFSSSGFWDRTLPVCANHAAMSCQTRTIKAKGSWEEKCSAKRRRRSGSNHCQRTRVLDTQQHTREPSPRRSNSTQRSGVGRHEGEEVTEEEQQKVSVVEMVAFLEQRTSEQQIDSKPALTVQRSSTTIMLYRALAPEAREGSEVRGEELESISVTDMVAKLESECLRRRTEGDLSRNNSLRRTVGRVLLAAGDQSSAPSHPASSSVTLSMTSSASVSSLMGAQSPISCSKTPSHRTWPPHSSHVRLGGLGGGRGLAMQSSVAETEPPPGLLFLSLLPVVDSHPSPPPTEPRSPAVGYSPNSDSQSDNWGRRKADGCQEGEVTGASLCSDAMQPSRRASVSQDFLEMRQRLQQLLEPQPYLAVLPHHLLVKIFLLLPTQSLAALKCSCHYFKFVIENYGVRPADSLWVSDPRYSDDPCKQCKKRYGRGDVSLCRWHHKPYCQALPYGPGYWMCCHGAHRDAPGCNVGLHDNHWVPAFHSINVPIYRRSLIDN
ncbi:F-box only protein 34 [Hippoglossus hippoglossus]|uniref:F-box only protein 34 n=1 Tax=Hippoglossus hippoglossus TaxID=8267 RepID=UPI00148DBE95|nr:F-box only protein 34 [Hippoglossus hippoglossus]